MRSPSIAVALAVLCLDAAAARADVSPADATTRAAIQALRAGRFDEAVAKLQEALTLDPTHRPALEGLGNAYFGRNMYAAAIDAYTRLLRQHPAYALAQYNIAYSLRKAGRFEEAVRAYAEYVRRVPTDPDAFFGLAESSRALGRTKDAIRYFELYVGEEKRPSEAAWVAKAKAEIARLRVLDLTAQHADTARLKADADAERRRHDAVEAARGAEEAARRKSVEDVARRAREDEAARQAAAEERRRRLSEELAARDPAERARVAAVIAKSRMVANAEAARRAQAEGEARRIIAQAGETRAPAAPAALAPARKVGSPTVQESFEDERAPLAPVDPSRLPPVAARVAPRPEGAPAVDAVEKLRAGDALFRKQDFPAALAQYRLAARAAPQRPEPFYKLGLAHVMLGDWVRAIRAFERVLRISADHPGARKNLALCRQKLIE